MNKTNGKIVDCMNNFLEEIRTEKAANLRKAATDPSDPTSHPVMSADDGTQPAREGARSAENKADVKKLVGGLAVTGQEDANSAKGKDAVDTIGTQKQDADEKKGNVPTPKSKKDMPDESTGHPSNKDMGKYSSYAGAAELGKSLLLELGELKVANDNGQTVATESPAPAANAAPTQMDKEAAAKAYTEDAQSGYIAAQTLATQLGMLKTSEQMEQEIAINSVVENIIKSAEQDAHLYAEFLASHLESVKKAEGEMPPEAAAASAGAAEEAPSGEGGAPAGMPPEAGGGAGGPPGAEGGAGGGGPEAELEQLAAALEAAGVSPEELAQAIAQIEAEHGGGAGGEAGAGAPPPEAGGMMPPPEAGGAPPAPAGM